VPDPNLLVQRGELFAQQFACGQQRLDDFAKVRAVLDELINPLLEFDLANHPDLQGEIAQQSANVILYGNRLFLQELARGQ
jgi:hypothetical protein